MVSNVARKSAFNFKVHVCNCGATWKTVCKHPTPPVNDICLKCRVSMDKAIESALMAQTFNALSKKG